MVYFKLPERDFLDLMGYLKKRPYDEVVVGISSLMRLERIVEPDPVPIIKKDPENKDNIIEKKSEKPGSK